MMNVRTGTASVVFYKIKNNEIFVLTGKETKFLSNYKKNLLECFGLDILRLQKFPILSQTEDVTTYFSREARFMTQFLNNNMDLLNASIEEAEFKIEHPIFVIYDEPITIGKTITTNYRFLSRGFSLGVVKGGIEMGETPADAIRREIREELNKCIEPSLLCVSRNHHMFYYMVEEPVDEFLKDANDMIYNDHRGELVELQFQNFGELFKKKNKKSLNNKSLEILKEFRRALKKIDPITL